MGLISSTPQESIPVLYKKGCTVDLETSFLSKGYHRTDQRILEIGAASLDTDDTFNVLVHPFETHLPSGKELVQQLISMGQQAMPTIDFWITILEKKNIIRKVKRSNDIKADYIANIINQNIKYEDKHTKNVPRSKRLQALTTRKDNPKIFMVTQLTAIAALQRFTKTYGNIWYAHNGKSFDFKILDATAKRVSMNNLHIQKIDTLHLFKQQHKGLTSYSQPNLFKHFIKGTYNAHVALDDAIALKQLMTHLHLQTTKQKQTNLQQLKYCGPVTETLLHKHNIHTIQQLKQKVKKTPNWLQTIGVKHHKKIKEQL